MKLSPAPTLHPTVAMTQSDLGTYTEVGADCVLTNAVLGDYSYCGARCDIANARIGKFANIATNVRIGPTDHPLDRASLHHFMYRSSYYWDDAADDADFFAARATRLTHIGHDTWIGHGAIIKPGLTIGNGAVIAAGAVVTHDVAPYTIVAGLPAAPLRRRLPEDLAARLQALAWWDWPHDRLREALEDFRSLSVTDFLRKHEAVEDGPRPI
ncbi:DapH/DapD/GlmU-related protein [Falsirhodobacter sp. 20TX0035]|uniref:DapH/DapD/GlmU-related protein n=1 Tax=Falsirhodobacter sp. 20TX0035 TaxID=3022019 RepID=UPI00232CFD7F|nr:DapH/DapD/GlmU-related protein [Falsirhodobacter sp. 20TX0035]MDB6452730.1 DapH/DapD/GlmU-related protein [Falsirhodobacter sp. 20TX0035]